MIKYLREIKGISNIIQSDVWEKLSSALNKLRRNLMLFIFNISDGY